MQRNAKVMLIQTVVTAINVEFPIKFLEGIILSKGEG